MTHIEYRLKDITIINASKKPYLYDDGEQKHNKSTEIYDK